MTLYRVEICSPINTRWISVRALDEKTARAVTKLRRNEFIRRVV